MSQFQGIVIRTSIILDECLLSFITYILLTKYFLQPNGIPLWLGCSPLVWLFLVFRLFHFSIGLDNLSSTRYWPSHVNKNIVQQRNINYHEYSRWAEWSYLFVFKYCILLLKYAYLLSRLMFVFCFVYLSLREVFQCTTSESIEATSVGHHKRNAWRNNRKGINNKNLYILANYAYHSFDRFESFLDPASFALIIS